MENLPTHLVPNPADPVADFLARQGGHESLAGALVTAATFRDILSLALAGHPIAKQDYVICQSLLALGFTRSADPEGALERRLLGESAKGFPPAALARRMDSALRVLLLRAYVFFRAGGLPWPVVGCFGEKSAVILSGGTGNGLVVDPASGDPKSDLDTASFKILSNDGVAEFQGNVNGAFREAFYVRTADVVTLSSPSEEPSDAR